MTNNIFSSIGVVSGNIPSNNTFGTGFLFAKRGTSAFVLTCAHVIEAVGGPDGLIFSGSPAKVVAMPENGLPDIAVLEVPDLSDKTPLPLHPTVQEGDQIMAAGFHALDNFRLLRPVRGVLGKNLFIEMPGNTARSAGWDILLNDEFPLQPGYSGSPVFHEQTLSVLGIVTHRIGQGQKGIILSISELNKVWSEFLPTSETTSLRESGISRLLSIRIASLEGRINLLLSQYQAIQDQITVELDHGNRVLLTKKSELIEKNIQEIDDKIRSLN